MEGSLPMTFPSTSRSWGIRGLYILGNLQHQQGQVGSVKPASLWQPEFTSSAAHTKHLGSVPGRTVTSTWADLPSVKLLGRARHKHTLWSRGPTFCAEVCGLWFSCFPSLHVCHLRLAFLFHFLFTSGYRALVYVQPHAKCWGVEGEAEGSLCHCAHPSL